MPHLHLRLVSKIVDLGAGSHLSSILPRRTPSSNRACDWERHGNGQRGTSPCHLSSILPLHPPSLSRERRGNSKTGTHRLRPQEKSTIKFVIRRSPRVPKGTNIETAPQPGFWARVAQWRLLAVTNKQESNVRPTFREQFPCSHGKGASESSTIPVHSSRLLPSNPPLAMITGSGGKHDVAESRTSHPCGGVNYSVVQHLRASIDGRDGMYPTVARFADGYYT